MFKISKIPAKPVRIDLTLLMFLW